MKQQIRPLSQFDGWKEPIYVVTGVGREYIISHTENYEGQGILTPYTLSDGVLKRLANIKRTELGTVLKFNNSPGTKVDLEKMVEDRMTAITKICQDAPNALIFTDKGYCKGEFYTCL